MFSRMRWLLLLLLFTTPALLLAAIPSADWKTLQSDHFKIHYLPTYTDQAKRVVSIAEDIFQQMSGRFYWIPKERINVVITDEYDSANGSASPSPFNLVILRLSPPDSVETLEDYHDWLSLLIEHELTHTFHIDKARGKAAGLRSTFGRFLLFFPNILQPSWMVEGLATYVETHHGIGRGQSSSFEMIMREQVRRGIQPVNRVNLPPDSLPLNRHYLYGVYFYQFLHEKYGEAAIYRLIENYSDNILPFAINSNSIEVLGKDLTQLWDEFAIYLQDKFKSQFQILNHSASEQDALIADDFIRLTQLEVLEDKSLLYIHDDYESEPKLVKMQKTTGQTNVTELTEINANSFFAAASNNVIYLSQPDFCDEYRLYYDLYQFNTESGKLKQITKCQRYKHFAVNKFSHHLAAARTIKSIPQIDLLNDQGQKIKTIWQGQYGDVLNQLDWSEKRNSLLISKKEHNKSWSVYEFELSSLTWNKLLSDNFINMNPVYTADEEGFLYQSDKSGVYNIYKYSFAINKSIAVTNVDSGAFSAVNNTENQITYLKYHANGYQLYTTADTEKAPAVIRPLERPVRSEIAAKQVSSSEYIYSEYTPWPDLKPKYWLPIFTIQDKGSELGFITASNDSLRHHFYELNLAYGVDQEELIGSLYYQYENWLGFFIDKENTLYTSGTSNETTLIRANTQMQITLSKPVTSIKQRWNFKLGLIGQNDKDSYRAPGVTGFLENDDDLLALSAYYDSKRSFLKSNSSESGRDVLLVTETSDAFNSDYEGLLLTFEWREFFNIGYHQTLAFRYVTGAADLTMRPYKLGGLDTDWEDVTIFNPQFSRDIFNKRSFALRGYEKNTQSGNNIELLSVEWRFPLQQVEKGIMTPPLGIVKHSGRLFTEAGSSWYDADEKDIITSAGFEWVMDTNLFYYLNFQLRFGYAKGLDEGGDEFYYIEGGTSF